MNKTTTIAGPTSLEAQLEKLRATGAYRFDPTKFCYLEAVFRRAADLRPVARRSVLKRAAVVLDQYRDAFCTAKEAATRQLGEGLKQFPEKAEQLQNYYDRCDFSGLRRALLTLNRQPPENALADLTAYIGQPTSVVAASDSSSPFDDMLRQVEHSLVHGKSQPDDHSSPFGDRDDNAELSSVHYFRESLLQRNADKLVTQAAQDIPEGAGPLNPQKLIVQSLTNMRELSPHYLNRFVAYIDTLLWLEQSADK